MCRAIQPPTALCHNALKFLLAPPAPLSVAVSDTLYSGARGLRRAGRRVAGPRRRERYRAACYSNVYMYVYAYIICTATVNK